jgi:hypothetical protein
MKYAKLLANGRRYSDTIDDGAGYWILRRK